jgi:lipopolysaccharide transport system ATP-binding protein
MISVEGIGKRYRIQHQSGRQYRALRDVIAARARRLLGGGGGASTAEEFWALRDVSFTVAPGEVLGIIGRNGAGKSTLLKVLSRITEPTTGRIVLDGRVASLLEVGTGFHPELTGRENIFLNGAILGMTRAEMQRKFDEIVAFAETERFLDTQVKRYSSGMYMRLAFAVAAHLESEILVIDEVLAVGDAEFQRRCLGKMRQVAGSGRTVLFVSHNLNAVEQLCTSAMCLNAGRVEAQGQDVRQIINAYLTSAEGTQAAAAEWTNPGTAFDHPAMRPTSLAVVDAAGRPLQGPARNDQPLFVAITIDLKQPDPAFNAGFSLFDQDSRELLWSLTTDGPEASWPVLEPGLITFRCALPQRLLNEGHYRLELNCSLHCRDWILRPGHNSPSVHFEIRGGLSDSPYWTFARPGLFAPEWKWERIR